MSGPSLLGHVRVESVLFDVARATMREGLVSPLSSASEVVLSRPSVLVRDEDLLSPDMQAGLEQLGGALGVVLACALFFRHLRRARRVELVQRSENELSLSASRAVSATSEARDV